jgi:hypothetical protein
MSIESHRHGRLLAGAMLTLTTALPDRMRSPLSSATSTDRSRHDRSGRCAAAVRRRSPSDDPFFGNGETGHRQELDRGKRPVELHLFEQGGHGFGMYPKETTSTGWFEEFARWLGHARNAQAGSLIH